MSPGTGGSPEVACGAVAVAISGFVKVAASLCAAGSRWGLVEL